MTALRELEWDVVPKLYNMWVNAQPRTLGMIPDRECWEVTSHALRSGYGAWNPDAHDGEGLIHRWVYFNAHPDADRSLCVLHLCDNPACVRLSHLYLGTKADNARDMQSRGRGSIEIAKAVSLLVQATPTPAMLAAKRRNLALAAALPRTEAQLAASRENAKLGMAKTRMFTDEQVKEMRALKVSGWSRKCIADKFECSLGAVNKIIGRERYAHVM